MKNRITTIKLSKYAVGLLNKLKIHPRQPYEEVVLKLISEYDETNHQNPKLHSKFAVTTIKLSKNTAESLNKLKVHPRQAYEEVILKLVAGAKVKK